ncbi:MAG: hypothetical protein L3J25_05015 [Flavobacteriaceae bacterium]|nr:hypothetical protein [Flavobacteriaceae bacterium]
MKKYLLVLIASSNLLFQDLYAQERFATIEKNVNFRASNLFHGLNKTRDTLLLKSDKEINYVYSINKDNNREIDYHVNANSFKVPLKNLSKGKHVFSVVQAPLLIVFVVHIFKDSPPIIVMDEDDVAVLKN